ncbi:tetratricopeptide repeat protein [Leptothoe sp. PORK10 BA2]|uniref:tetratricopeptide repeat protein n=1 Tax=Leptothoe sp. PORK10 BA2 TaxID=3110254 RepID=UPI002B1EDD8B|nr:tetratricopeptide repeat protein [Leptothoe sp. PORK10 BA2]MEA5464994.1 tetratricopeptide repeat protein [Leptothoe sp. PORK10 BA2]
MTTPALGTALTAYRNALDCFGNEQRTDEQQVMTVLNARDVLHTVLEQSLAPKPHLLKEIHTLDRQFKDQAAAMAEQFNFGSYRHSFPKQPEHWWWFLDETVKPPDSNPDDWVFKGLTTLTWAISIGLLINISGRFLLGGAGVAGLSAIALSNLLTLLKARSDLTDAGSEGAQVFFDRFKVSKPWRLRTKFGTTALLTGALFAFWLALPSLSRQYNQRGQSAWQKGKLGSAEQAYNLAISLNPDNVDAHYNLGTLYEDIQELDKAETQYLIAIRGNLPEAYNNLVRLYLQSPENNLNKSLALLNQGLRLAEEQKSFPETQFSLYKNLGWALLQQEEYPFAASALDVAISIYEQLSASEQEYVANPGSAYCLVAQVRETTGQEDALPAWQRCCQLGDRSVPEENAWLTIARDRFDAEGLNYEKVCQTNALPL